jgi:Family of unknown function (DUF6174)
MRSRLASLRPILAAAALVAACDGGTLVIATGRFATGSFATHREHWMAHGITSYSYQLRVTGFFIVYAGRSIVIVVRGGAVESATYADTGAPAPGPLSQWPTIDALFDRGEAAQHAGALRDAAFDASLDYPTELDLNGPPDASGSVFASDLRPLPGA